jgi:hypothetical protein
MDPLVKRKPIVLQSASLAHRDWWDCRIDRDSLRQTETRLEPLQDEAVGFIYCDAIWPGNGNPGLVVMSELDSPEQGGAFSTESANRGK